MGELVVLAIFGVAAAFWFDSRAVQDVAVARCRQACADAGVQFLDDIAPAWRVRLQRDGNGVIRLRRVFEFEYSTASGERRSGFLIMLGRVPILLRMAEDLPEQTDAAHRH